MNGKLILIAGPSGAGKTTVALAVLKRIPHLTRLITYTSKDPRPGEADGVDYHFVTTQRFEELIKEDFFIEHANVYGNWYGVPRSVLDDLYKGMNILAVVDVQGVHTLKMRYPYTTAVWIDAPSDEELARRLGARDAVDAAQTVRFKSITEERLQAHGMFEYELQNAVLDETVHKVEDICKKVLKNR